MQWIVAERFGFPASEIEGMEIRRLRFWYRGVTELVKHEKEGMKSGKPE